MPASLGIGFFVLGAVLILIALVGGKFKIFVAEISPSVTNPFVRVIAFGLGILFIVLSLNLSILNTASPVATESTTFIPSYTQTSIPPTPTDLPPTVAPSQPSPGEFVLSYWQNVNDGNYENAWTQLSPGFRQAHHQNDYSDYQNGYYQMGLCRIAVSNINVVQQDLSSAVVTAQVTYYTGSSCSSSEYNFEMWLVYDNAGQSWSFDRNFIKP